MTGAAGFDIYVLLDLAIVAMLLVVGVAIILTRNLFAVAMLSGAYSLLSAAFFVNADAVDVAVTEAAVGAGVSTIFMLSAMLLTSQVARPTKVARAWGSAIACVAVGGTLLYAVVDLPAFGDPNSPANSYVGKMYLERTPEDISIPNVVTGTLASYRGYDTLGETVVIFTAGLGVMLILGLKPAAPLRGGLPARTGPTARGERDRAGASKKRGGGRR